MDERQHAIDVAIQILAAADGLEPGGAPHLVMTTADLRHLLEAGGVAPNTIDDALHHAAHEHGAGKTAALKETWRPSPVCPVCGARAIPIVYGMPAAPLGALSRLGVIELGGCVIGVDDADYRCGQCGELWS